MRAEEELIDMRTRTWPSGIAISLICAVASCLSSSGAFAQSAAPGVDILVIRTLEGTYSCTTLDTNEDCGRESWIMTALADGTRVLNAHQQIQSLGVQNNTILRVDSNFRPLDAFTNLYSRNRFFGSGAFLVKGASLHIAANAPDEQDPTRMVVFSEEIAVPEMFSLLLYPNSAYGWSLAGYDVEKAGIQQAAMCVFAATGQQTSCAMMDQPLDYVGRENVEVPAGAFDTEHYKVGNSGDTWIYGPDRVVVQHQHTGRKTRFQLVRFDETLSD